MTDAEIGPIRHFAADETCNGSVDGALEAAGVDFGFSMNYLDEQEFYELCQQYRWAQEWTEPTVFEAFEELKAFIRKHRI